jgi:hypothetical protein
VTVAAFDANKDFIYGWFTTAFASGAFGEPQSKESPLEEQELTSEEGDEQKPPLEDQDLLPEEREPSFEEQELLSEEQEPPIEDRELLSEEQKPSVEAFILGLHETVSSKQLEGNIS